MTRKLRTYIIGLQIMLFSIWALMTVSCKRDKSQSLVESQACYCDSLWSKPITKAFVEKLEFVRKSELNVWPNYRLGDGNYVLNAGLNNDGSHCLGLWKENKKAIYDCVTEVPEMLTPLYGYYLGYDAKDSIDLSKYKSKLKNARAFNDWMETNQVDRAVYMPTEFPKFPITISAKMKTQLAVHEMFHLETMLRHWHNAEGNWPEWDTQPNRNQMRNCYQLDDIVAELAYREQLHLRDMIDHLIVNNIEMACVEGQEFLLLRKSRYNRVKDIRIVLDDKNSVSCETAENLMEIEEGLADYGSWTAMYKIGAVDKTDILKRYSAKQNDKFYLTGAMLMHAIELIDRNTSAIDEVISSASQTEGALIEIFKKRIKPFCKSSFEETNETIGY